MSTSENRLVQSSLPESDVMVRATSSISFYEEPSLTQNTVEYDNTITKSFNLKLVCGSRQRVQYMP
jgi:hypothetical protein